MLRVVYRIGMIAGLVASVLMMAGAVLALPSTGRKAALPIAKELHPQAAEIAPNFSIDLSTVVASGVLNHPLEISHAGDGSGRLFVLERSGTIRVIKNGLLLSTPYLNVTSQVECCNSEQGLTGLDFDPNFESNGTFYLNYTTNAANFVGDTVVVRYQVTNPAADVANLIKVTPIITIDQPQSNHNGGDLHFGPDGYLYIGMGDGGNSNDVGPGHAPEGNGQSPSTLLGKMLRIDVQGVPTYTIPPGNPFTRTVGYKPEIWSLGWRNPWRFSFDRLTGDMYVGDVGQGCWEEISYEPAGSPGGKNYGWPIMEGFHQFNRSNNTQCFLPLITPPTVTLPITAYGHTDSNFTVSGGYVYRGQQYPWLHGLYFYGDYGSGRIWAIQQVNPGIWVGAEKKDTPYQIAAFGEDENGELYVADYQNGGIYKITSSAPVDFSTSSKSASTTQAKVGNTVTYTIVVRNTGAPFYDTVRVTDTIPVGLSYVAGSLTATSGTRDDSAAPTLKWQGVMSTTPLVTLTFAASVTTPSAAFIVNTATIDQGTGSLLTRTASILVNPLKFFLSIILRKS